MKKSALILAILFLTITVLFGTKSVLSNRLSTTGVALGELQDGVKKYKTQNVILREQVNMMSSLSNISSAAAELGFVESKDNFALTKSRPIAIRQ